MDAGSRFSGQLKTMIGSLTSGQRLSLSVTVLVVVGSLAYLIFRSGDNALQPVSFGRSLSTSEVESAVSLLTEHDISVRRSADGQVLVPGQQLDQANGLLLVRQELGQQSALGESSEVATRKPGLFTTRSEMEALRESELKADLSRIIGAIPGIKQATVRWAREAQPERFSRGEKRKATVFVIPEDEAGLGRELIHALRHGVASAVSDLAPENVTVFDISSGAAYTSLPDEVEVGDVMVQQAREWSDRVQKQIAEQLAYIPDVRVAVSVRWQQINPTQRLDSTGIAARNRATAVVANEGQPAIRQAGNSIVVPNQPLVLPAHQANHPSESFLPKTVGATLSGRESPARWDDSLKVMIAIPDEYYRSLMSREGLDTDESGFDRRAYHDRLARLQQRVEADVEQTVAGLAGAAVAEIDVRSMIASNEGRLAKDNARWYSNDAMRHILLIAAVLIFAGIIVIRSRPKKPSPPRRGAATELESDGSESAVMDASLEEPTELADLEELVNRNPDRATAVLSHWLGTQD